MILSLGLTLYQLKGYVVIKVVAYSQQRNSYYTTALQYFSCDTNIVYLSKN